MPTLLTDIRYAVRSLRSSPGVSLIVLLTLALGIGATGAIWSVLDGVVLQPLRYQEPSRLTLVTSQFPTMGFDRFWLSPPEYLELEEWNRSWERIAGYRSGDASVVGGEEPIRVRAMYATASLLDVLGVAPALGRYYTAEEDTANGPGVAVVTHEFWQREMGGSEGSLGKSLEIDGVPSVVIGVLPPQFDIEESGAEIYLPVQLDRSDRSNRGSHFLNVVGRLHDDVTLDGARAEVAQLIETWQERAGADHAPSPDVHPLRVLELQDEVIGDTRPALFTLLGAVVFVLLIACANVANLLLARSDARQREMTVRAALGASRMRLVRQVLTESVLLSLLGGALGIAVAWQGLRLLLDLYPEALPRTGEITLDGRVLLMCFAIAVSSGLVFGLAPALQLSSSRFGVTLKEGARRTTQGLTGRRFRQGLVVAEIALAVALVIGAALMIRSFLRLSEVDPGFDQDALVTFELFLPASGYPETTDRAAFLDRLIVDTGAVPGVRSVSATSNLPPVRSLDANDTEFEGIEPTEDGPPQNTDYWEFIKGSHLETMGTRVVAGRDFATTDNAASTPVVLVNQRLVDIFYPDREPLGQRLRPPFFENVPWFTIVGVVEDVKQDGLDREAGTHIYWNYDQTATLGFARQRMYIVARSERSAEALAPELRATVWNLDASLPVANIRTMETVVSDSLSRPRLVTLLLFLFGATALFLATIGIYGVLSYTVTQRAQEMGIRMAMGADRTRILGIVLRQGMSLAASGLVIGAAAALALSRVVRSLLFGVEATDAATYAQVVGFLAAVSLLACLLPALRATRVDPIDVLRYE